jgi:hypothetical protein
MENAVERGRAERADDLLRDAEDGTDGERTLRRHPRFGCCPIDQLARVDEVVVLVTEIVELRDIDVVDLLRCARLVSSWRKSSG